jgi:hypothetical protein
VLFLAASAVPFGHRWALELDPKSSNFVTIRQIKPTLTGITIPVFHADVQLILYVFSVM